MARVNICEINVDNLSSSEVLNRIDNIISSGRQGYVVTPNVDHVMQLQRDKQFQKIYAHADLVLADGMPLLMASFLLGDRIKEKISGSDLTWKLMEHSQRKGYRVFLLGGRPHAAERARDVLLSHYPKLRISGICCPPFGFEKSKEHCLLIARRIRRAVTDILFVGLGAPKQERWIFSYQKYSGAALAIGVGITFEFIAGMVKRAPRIMQKTGFEWLWRLAMEPQRLWKRYLYDTLFFYLLFKQMLRHKRSLDYFDTITRNGES